MYVENKIILTDCDGVLLDWEKMFHLWMENKGYTVATPGLYKINEVYDMEKALSKRLIKEFNESAWMAFLPAFRDARSGVAKLVEAGYKFVCITSLSLDENARRLRIENLEKVFGEGIFEEVIALDTGADKDEALEPFRNSNLYWIEDKDENAITGADFGLRSVLIEHAHNVACEDGRIARAANWAEIADLILSNP